MIAGFARVAAKGTHMRARLSYANVAATLAVFLAVAGGSAYAAQHYLITSSKQISPTVLRQLRGARGKQGAAGIAGSAGAVGTPGANGAPGTNGAPGAAAAPGGAGATGASGATGATGDPGSAAASVLSGRVTSIPTTASGQSIMYGAADGLTAANATEASVQTLSPNDSFTAQNLIVQKTGAAVPTGDQIIVDMDVGGSPVLICGIQAGQTSCNSNTQTDTVTAASQLSIKIIAQAASASIPGFDLLFGFQAG